MPVAAPLQLEQSVPNPARGTARISYQVPAGSHAVLLLRRVLDGQPIAALEMKANATFYDLDLSRYPAGTYFYTLTTDDGHSLMRRLVVE